MWSTGTTDTTVADNAKTTLRDISKLMHSYTLLNLWRTKILFYIVTSPHPPPPPLMSDRFCNLKTAKMLQEV